MFLVAEVGILIPTRIQRECGLSTNGTTKDQPDLQKAINNCAKRNEWLETEALGDELEFTEII